ncbi:MAG: hypothetical protein ABI846_07865 [Rudaea sp.]
MPACALGAARVTALAPADDVDVRDVASIEAIGRDAGYRLLPSRGAIVFVGVMLPSRPVLGEALT